MATTTPNRLRANTGNSASSVRARTSSIDYLKQSSSTIDPLVSFSSLDLDASSSHHPSPARGRTSSITFSSPPTTKNQNVRRSSSVTFSGTRRHKVIDWVQQVRIKLPRRMRSSTQTYSASGMVPLIDGLDRVVFGSAPAAEVVTILGHNPPRYVWYMVSGTSCDIIQLGIDLLLLYFFHVTDASTCWAMSFSLSIAFRHTTHRYLVFGDYIGGYWASLGRMYAGYSVSILVSTLFNMAVTKGKVLGVIMPHYVAWIFTMLWTGLANYFILKKLWTFGGSSNGDGNSSKVSLKMSDV